MFARHFLIIPLFCSIPLAAHTAPTIDLYAPDILITVEESVCDNEPPNRVGLCIDFCEDMNCHLCVELPDSSFDCTDVPEANSISCEHIRDEWLDLVAIPGARLPCQEPPVTCPCSGHPEWEDALVAIDVFGGGPVPVLEYIRRADGLGNEAGTAFSTHSNSGMCDALVVNSTHLLIPTTSAEGEACAVILASAGGPV